MAKYFVYIYCRSKSHSFIVGNWNMQIWNALQSATRACLLYVLCFVKRFDYECSLCGGYLNQDEETSLLLLFRLRLILVNSAETQLSNF